jgi:hypothetical protein
VVHTLLNGWVFEPPVPYLRVPRVENVIERLEKDIRLLNSASVAGYANAVLAKELRKTGKWRFELRGTHIGKNEASGLHAWIRWLPDGALECAGRRFGWLIEAIPCRIELPAVVEAAYP